MGGGVGGNGKGRVLVPQLLLIDNFAKVKARKMLVFFS